MQSPNGPWNNFLGGVAAVTPLDMWAVGNSQDPITRNDQYLAEHWDGMRWTTVSTPNPVGSNDLNDVAAVATNDVWAVGVSNSSNRDEGVALHWNGSAWLDVSPGGLSAPNALNDVTAIGANDVWAVGDTFYNVRQLVTQHWNGSGWTIVPATSPSNGNADSVFYGVGASSSSDVWAVGYYRATQSGPRQVLIEHSTGGAWSLASADPMPVNSTLLSVAATSASDAWGVGYTDIGGGGSTVLTVHWNGTKWTPVSVPNMGFVNRLGDVVALAANDYYAVGYTGSGMQPLQPLFAHWTGSAWAQSFGAANGLNALAFSVAVPAAGDVWSVGTYQEPGGLSQALVESDSSVTSIPGTPAAVARDQSAKVSWSSPCSDGGSPITAYVVTAYDLCNKLGSVTVTGSPPALTATIAGLGNGNLYFFTVAPVNGFGLGPESGEGVGVRPTGPTPTTWLSACSNHQTSNTGSDGINWGSSDGQLQVSFVPTTDLYAVLSGNADLWTANAGYNQDLGIWVSGGRYGNGTVVAWKESGGSGGTFSPNAAYVQTVIPVNAGINYVAILVMKANRPDTGTIYMGAGRFGPNFSPSRITARLFPASSALLFKASTTQQYKLTSSDGSAWSDVDTTNLEVPFTTPSTGSWVAMVSGNADLWTSTAGYNQDLGVSLAGPGYPTMTGLPEAWKESGGLAGTYSPNAAFVQVALPVAANSAYTARLKWKANQPDPGTIWAGAGPIFGQFSPTALTVILVPAGGVSDFTGRNQYTLVNSDGSYWQRPNSSGPPQITLVGGASYLVSLNADLWTAVAGYNQDMGIMVSGGVYGAGTLVAWKESGGRSGTYSPNAAFVSTVLSLQDSTIHYNVWMVWKTNSPSTVNTQIVAGAGPITSGYSPTMLTAVQLS